MDEKDKIIEELKEEIRILKELVAALMAENAELKARLNKNSRNSGKPPSSDGPRKPVVKNSRKPSEKPSGGQQGHIGVTKPLTPSPDRVVLVMPKTECECGGEIITETGRYTVRQVTDVEPIKVITVEYRAHSGVCCVCGKVHKASFPEHIKSAPASYGENIEALVTYLTSYQLIPLKRAVELVEDLLGVKISQGFIVQSAQEAYEKLAETEEQIKRDVIGSDTAHFDESGIRVGGKTHWLHSADTKDSTVYTIHEKRGREAMDDMGILPNYRGNAIHDHWKSYYHYDQCAHGECNEHHLRHLTYLHEELEQAWAGDMAALLLRIKKHVDLNRLFGADSLEQDDIETYERMYRDILANVDEKSENTPVESRRMVKRLSTYEQETLLFMLDFDVPFTNNLAERDIRMPKAKQKISGGFRSDEGAKCFARIRGFISTAKKRGRDVLDGLTAAFKGRASDFISKDTIHTQGAR
jgi:hypothetical protein